MSRWNARRASELSIPSSHALLTTSAPTTPGEARRLALLQEHWAEVSYVYHRRVIPTPLEAGGIVAVVHKADSMGAALIAGSDDPTDRDRVQVLSGPREPLIRLLAPRSLADASQVQHAPRGVLVVVVLAFDGITLWSLPGLEAPATGWAPAMMMFSRKSTPDPSRSA